MKLHFVVKKFVEDNAPSILSGAAMIGTAATGYLAARGGIRAGVKLHEEVVLRHRNDGVALTVADKIKLVGIDFIPAMGTGAATVTCIFFSHKISASRIVAMTAAYSLSENKLKEYKSKVEEKLGIEKKKEIDDAIVEDKMKKMPKADIVFLNADDVLCFDSYSGRYFKSSQEAIRQAVNNTNFEVIQARFATLEFFWNELGLEPTAYSDEYGWTDATPLHVRFSTTMSSDDKPCLVVDYEVVPVRGWDPVNNAHP